MTTQLGLACLASSLSPDEGLRALLELKQARKCFVLENELHLVYLVVPIYAAVSWPNLDWMSYLSLWETLPSDVKRVGELVGVEERFLVRAMRGTISTKTERQVRNSVCELFSVHVLFCYDFSHLCALQARQLAVHQRFYTALALHDLVNEVPLGVVSQKYGATKGTSNAALFEKRYSFKFFRIFRFLGMLQSLQQAASTFAGMITAFCHKLGWLNLELLLGQFQVCDETYSEPRNTIPV